MNLGHRWQTFGHALAFVVGFSIVFVVLGASVAFFGYALNRYLSIVVVIGGVILILFGLQVAGVLDKAIHFMRRMGADQTLPGRASIALLDVLARSIYADRRLQVRANRRWGYLSSAVMGIFFSAGWIPCVGPVLAAIYFLASDTQTVAQGALLLAVYSAGLGIPLLLTGAAFSTMTEWLRRLNRHVSIVSKLTGLLLIFVGVLLAMDRLAFIANFLVARFGTGLASLELDLASVSMVTIPIAFIAGLLSFLSPCVLPLIPAYIGYLSGTAVNEVQE